MSNKIFTKKVYEYGNIVCDMTGRTKTYYYLMLRGEKIGAIKFMSSYYYIPNSYQICLCDGDLTENDVHDAMDIICSFINDNPNGNLDKFNIVNKKKYINAYSKIEINCNFFDNYKINPYIAGKYVMIATDDEKTRIISTEKRDQLVSIGVNFKGMSSYYIPYSCNGGNEIIKKEKSFYVCDKFIDCPIVLFIKNYDDFRNSYIGSDSNIVLIVSTNDKSKKIFVPKLMYSNVKKRKNISYSVEIIKNNSHFLKYFFNTSVFAHKNDENFFGLDYSFDMSNLYLNPDNYYSFNINIPNKNYIETLKTIKQNVHIIPHYIMHRFGNKVNISRSYPIHELIKML